MPSDTHIVPVMVGDPEKCKEASDLSICRSIKAQRIRSGDFLFKAQASVSHKIEPLNDPVSVRRDKESAFSTHSHLFHINHTCLTQFSPVSKSTEPVLPQPFGPLLRSSSTLKAHVVPTRPTDNSTFGTSISLIPITADHPRTVLACWCTSLSHCYSQAIPVAVP